MKRCLLLASVLCFADDEVVFRSDTTLVRLDVQVLETGRRAVTGLEKEAFHLKENGKEIAIKSFAAEAMAIDVLFLIDVSGSMRPHVERMAQAAYRALPGLRAQDRVGIMVFDRSARLRTPFRPAAEGAREFDYLLRSESFDGGTDITRALLTAARTMEQKARKDARRAIVMLTDDQTEFDRDDERVARALHAAESVMSVLLVPAMTPLRGGGGMPRRGGVIIHGPQIGGPRIGNARTRSAGSADIARESGGDAMRADEAGALDSTLERIRQRYALFFSLPAGVREGEHRSIEVTLDDTLLRRYSGASLRYRRSYRAAASGSDGPVEDFKPGAVISEAPAPSKRRVATDGSSRPGPMMTGPR
ncbi:MAG: VWA domain-containing protein [Acidobacteria bacterium]|nr:VWA domain-containing protein [Acidobacteriota bacterium]